MDHRDLLTVIEHQELADAEIAPIWRELRERPLLRIARYVSRLTADGVARPAAPPQAIAEAIYGMFMHVAHLVAARPDEYDAAVEHLTAMYLRLLALPEHAPPSMANGAEANGGTAARSPR